MSTSATLVEKKEIVHQAVPAEDRMQAFLWRHLLPAQQLAAYQPPPKRVPPNLPEQAVAAQTAQATGTPAAQPKPKFTRQRSFPVYET